MINLKNFYKICLINLIAFFFVENALAGYLINGKLIGQESGKVLLTHSYSGKNHTDTALIKDGHFLFKGNTPEPLLYRLSIVGLKNQGVSFVLENTVIAIEANRDSLYKAKITGSKINDLYSSFYKVDWKPINDKAGLIYAKLSKAEQGGKVKVDSLTRKNIDDEFALLDILNDSVIADYVNRNKTSIAAALIIADRYISYPYPDKARKLYPLLSKEVQNSIYGKQVKEAIDLDTKLGVGREAPLFVQIDTAGKMIELKNFRGKYVLIDFWASWCMPCRAENPNVIKVYNKYHSKGFEIIGVSLDDKKEAWLNAIHNDGLTWTHLSDLKGWANDVAFEYGVKSVPASYLLDKDGKIIAKGLRGDALDKKLEEIFK